MKFKNPYNERKIKPGETFSLPSRTKQEFQSECDINEIMRRYELTGTISHISSQQPIYDDVSGITDYQSALEQVRKAEAAFNALPSELRKELDYDPANLIPYLQDEKNRERCVELGLFNKPVVEDPKVIVADTGTNNDGTLSS